MQPLFQYLNGVVPLSPTLTDHLSRVVKARRIAKNRFLLEEEEVSGRLWWLDKGLVRCFYSRGDHEVTTWFLDGNNLIVAMKSFCDQKKSKYYIQALENCETHYLDYAEVRYILSRFPEAKDIRIHVGDEYANLFAMRVRATSMQSPLAKYRYLQKHFSWLQGRASLDLIASFLDMDRRTLTKLRARRDR